MLVTSGNDRVFGEMVKAQQAEERRKKEKEYRERKEREYREKKEREKKEGKDKDKGKEVDKANAKDATDAKYKAEKKEKKEGATEQKPAQDAGKSPSDKPTPLPNGKAEHVGANKDKDVVAVIPLDETKAIAVVAVPAPAPKDTNPKDKDAQHEEEPMIVAPMKGGADNEGRGVVANVEKARDKGDKGGENDKQGEETPAKNKDVRDAKDVKEGKDGQDVPKPEPKPAPAKDGKDGKDRAKDKPRKHAPFDPVRDAALLANLLGPEAANLGVSELKAAFAALESAAAASQNKDAALKKDPNAPVIWTWHEPVEKWRWKNFAAGCAVLQPGCWEERDWVVFADDRGCEEHEEDQIWAEVEEVDVHDWSC